MPIKIPDHLPAVETLRQENIFVMTEGRATTQDIRPLRILLVNLMPKKIQTETQFSRLLGNTPLQIELDLIVPESHTSVNTPANTCMPSTRPSATSRTNTTTAVSSPARPWNFWSSRKWITGRN